MTVCVTYVGIFYLIPLYGFRHGKCEQILVTYPLICYVPCLSCKSNWKALFLHWSHGTIRRVLLQSYERNIEDPLSEQYRLSDWSCMAVIGWILPTMEKTTTLLVWITNLCHTTKGCSISAPILVSWCQMTIKGQYINGFILKLLDGSETERRSKLQAPWGIARPGQINKLNTERRPKGAKKEKLPRLLNQLKIR